MKMIVAVALALVAVSSAAPVEEPIQILRSNYDQSPEGGYVYGFETANGLVVNAIGELKQVNDEENKPHSVIVARGSYSYSDPEGNPQTINYYADETGYHAEGSSVPKAVSRR